MGRELRASKSFRRTVFMIVILSEAGSSRSELPAKSKDPYSLKLSEVAARSSPRAAGSIERMPFYDRNVGENAGILRLRSRFAEREAATALRMTRIESRWILRGTENRLNALGKGTASAAPSQFSCVCHSERASSRGGPPAGAKLMCSYLSGRIPNLQKLRL
jgi:hypothetical protein